MILATAFLINTAVVTVTMVIHYEALFWLSKKLPKLCQIRPRLQVLVGVLCVFIVHVIEIWLFAFAFYFSSMIEGMGKLTGNLSEGGGLLDCVYFSFVTFTTVGYGDVSPVGPYGKVIACVLMVHCKFLQLHQNCCLAKPNTTFS